MAFKHTLKPQQCSPFSQNYSKAGLLRHSTADVLLPGFLCVVECPAESWPLPTGRPQHLLVRTIRKCLQGLAPWLSG